MIPAIATSWSVVTTLLRRFDCNLHCVPLKKKYSKTAAQGRPITKLKCVFIGFPASILASANDIVVEQPERTNSSAEVHQIAAKRNVTAQVNRVSSKKIRGSGYSQQRAEITEILTQRRCIRISRVERAEFLQCAERVVLPVIAARIQVVRARLLNQTPVGTVVPLAQVVIPRRLRFRWPVHLLDLGEQSVHIRPIHRGLRSGDDIGLR